MDGLFMGNLSIILCFLLGLGLLFLEAFMPGFGLAGIAGVVLEVISIVQVNAHYGWPATIGATFVVLAALGITVSITLRSVSRGRLSKSSFILNDRETVDKGYTASSDLDVYLGKEGVAITVLRPAGMAEFAGAKLSVVSSGEFVAKGAHVLVEQVEGSRVVVRMISKEAG